MRTVVTSDISDLDFACSLFEQAIRYQKAKGQPHYVGVDRESFIQDITSGCHYKILVDGRIACTFSIHREDRPVWRAMSDDPAFYLHKATVNPEFKGMDMLSSIIDFISDKARAEGVHMIRLDTWADNVPLVNYYQKHGFDIVEYYQTPSDESINFNCRGNRVVLMEMQVNG